MGRLRSAAVCAMLACVVATAGAVERKYETPMGLIVVDVDAAWKMMGQVPPAINGIGFEQDGGRTMQFVLGSLNEMPPDGTDIVGLRKVAEALRLSEKADGLVVSDSLLSLSGPQFRGYYFVATAKRKTLPEHFDKMYSGLVLAGSNPIAFTIAWNEGGEDAAKRALGAVERLKLVPR